jgi:hypothetical protein
MREIRAAVATKAVRAAQCRTEKRDAAMIHLTHHDARYLALRNCYAHKDAIKMLADYPDVRWDKASGAWLVDNRLYDALADVLGKWLCAAPDFWCDFHTYEPPPAQPRRKSRRQYMAQKREEQAAAGRFGRVIVEMKR